ncbi:MAG: phytanoyl-CoA dioxygenase [Cellvibrionaceae bacterium]|nr:phytanoyl-CoA dioxygenase [Cellvibrionaceae bacterium]|tara:strand:+ start:11609 stop:12520 length:912 start_codon:yes stop_codon:yes gene_type:complete
MTSPLNASLSSEQVQHYRQQGYLFPLPVLSDTEAIRLRAELEGGEKMQGKPLDRLQCNKSYLLFDWADELVHHPAILDAVESLIGPDILCYMTNLFTKEAGSSSYVSMHQDAAYWGVDADDVVTAWVALSPATAESGVMKIQPSSHKTLLQQVNTYAKDNLLSRGQEIPVDNLDSSKQLYMELDPGQMSLHHFQLVHGSDANTSSDRRIGFAIRYVAATAKKIGAEESALLVRGDNHSGFIMEQRAKPLSRRQRIQQHTQALRRQMHNLFEPGDEANWQERLRLKATKALGLGLSYWKEISAR